jgi:hypothetical protein
MEKIRARQNSLWTALIGIGPSLAALNPARDWEPRRAKVKKKWCQSRLN